MAVIFVYTIQFLWNLSPKLNSTYSYGNVTLLLRIAYIKSSFIPLSQFLFHSGVHSISKSISRNHTSKLVQKSSLLYLIIINGSILMLSLHNFLYCVAVVFFLLFHTNISLHSYVSNFHFCSQCSCIIMFVFSMLHFRQ